MIAVEILDQQHREQLSGFNERTNWFLEHQSHFAECVSTTGDDGKKRLLSCCSKERLTTLLGYLFDEEEFLSLRDPLAIQIPRKASLLRRPGERQALRVLQSR